MNMEHWWNNTDSGQLIYLEETVSRCRFVHHIFTWTGLALYMGLHSEKPWQTAWNMAQPTDVWNITCLLSFLLFYNSLLIWGPILRRGTLCSTSIPTNDKTKCFSGQIWLEYTFLAKDQHIYEYQSRFMNHSKHFKCCQINTVIAMTSLLM